jgi:hypothetical protein
MVTDEHTCRMEKFWGSIAGMRKSKWDETIPGRKRITEGDKKGNEKEDTKREI